MGIAKIAGIFGICVGATGCATLEEMPPTDARLTGAALGGFLANELSNGDSRAVIAGAALGGGLAGGAATRAEERREEQKEREGECLQQAIYDYNGNLVGVPASCSRETPFPANIPPPGGYLSSNAYPTAQQTSSSATVIIVKKEEPKGDKEFGEPLFW